MQPHSLDPSPIPRPVQLDLINEKMGRMLHERDPCFQGLVVNGSVAVCVAADTAQLTPVFDEARVQRLADHLHEVVERLEKDDEVMMMIRAEVTKKGIEEVCGAGAVPPATGLSDEHGVFRPYYFGAQMN